jgi:hypothetical protein
MKVGELLLDYIHSVASQKMTVFVGYTVRTPNPISN